MILSTMILSKKAPVERVLMEKKAFDFRPSDFGQGFLGVDFCSLIWRSADQEVSDQSRSD